MVAVINDGDDDDDHHHCGGHNDYDGFLWQCLITRIWLCAKSYACSCFISVFLEYFSTVTGIVLFWYNIFSCNFSSLLFMYFYVSICVACSTKIMYPPLKLSYFSFFYFVLFFRLLSVKRSITALKFLLFYKFLEDGWWQVSM